MYEFLSEEGHIELFVSNEFLWLKCRLYPLKSCFSANCSGLEMAFLIDMLYNLCLILLSKTGQMIFLNLHVLSYVRNVKCEIKKFHSFCCVLFFIPD